MGIRPRDSWRNTTHDWASTVDLGHLQDIRRNPDRFARGGVLHLILEVLAYAADEAECGNGGRCLVTLHPDGFVSVADDGRGTDTRLDGHGAAVKKPIMATKDLRFYGRDDAPVLPDGSARAGISVVAALSEWVVHTNRRAEGGWSQRFEHGLPHGVPEAVPDLASTGTVVHFRPDPALVPGPVAAADVRAAAQAYAGVVPIEVVAESG
jgi:topoisomerase IV subunit B